MTDSTADAPNPNIVNHALAPAEQWPITMNDNPHHDPCSFLDQFVVITGPVATGKTTQACKILHSVADHQSGIVVFDPFASLAPYGEIVAERCINTNAITPADLNAIFDRQIAAEAEYNRINDPDVFKDILLLAWKENVFDAVLDQNLVTQWDEIQQAIHTVEDVETIKPIFESYLDKIKALALGDKERAFVDGYHVNCRTCVILDNQSDLLDLIVARRPSVKKMTLCYVDYEHANITSQKILRIYTSARAVHEDDVDTKHVAEIIFNRRECAAYDCLLVHDGKFSLLRSVV